jgi:hypothetical protein
VARKQLSIPAAIVAVVVGGALTACDDDDDDPQECTIEGICPEDGRVCLERDTAAPCCPICPVDGTNCPNGCILEFPPI